VHRGHHQLCTNNRRKSKAPHELALAREEKRLKELFAAPLTEAEKCSGRYITKEATAAHFALRQVNRMDTTNAATTTTTTRSTQMMETLQQQQQQPQPQPQLSPRTSYANE